MIHHAQHAWGTVHGMPGRAREGSGVQWAAEPAPLRDVLPCIMDVALDLEETDSQASRQREDNPGGKVSLK